MAEFKVVENSECVEDDWRVATVHEVHHYMDHVHEALNDDYEWHICRLEDGRISGPGYSYEVSHENGDGLGHKLLIQNPIELRIEEYGCHVDDGWRIACVRELKENWNNMREALADKEWHICALQDGTVGGPGYGFKIDYCHKELGHKVLINRPTLPVEFKVDEYKCDHECGWRMARVGEVLLNMDQVKEVLCDDYEWHICALVNGTVAGPGYNHEITHDVKVLGHKLLIKGGTPPPNDLRFVVEKNDTECRNHWRLATVADVKANMDKMKETLDDDFEWYICALVDGQVSGPGYQYELKDECGECGDKLCISY